MRSLYHSRRHRKGNIAVLSAISLIVLLGMIAFAIDIGYLLLARTELQRSADAAALAAAWELVDGETLTCGTSFEVLETNCREKAIQIASLNPVLRQNPAVAETDITIGYLSNYFDPTAQLDTSGMEPPNAVTVRIARDQSLNGRVPFFFAKILGINDAVAQAESTAAVLQDFYGFRTPSSGGNLKMLPFALDEDSWNNMLSGTGPDDWEWDEDLEEVKSGSDGILELNLYPQGTGSPGNRGAVDIGSNNNSTSDMARQILRGVTPEDLDYHGGVLRLDENGELMLNGDTGISAGVKDELLAIKGAPRIIPVFREVVGPGNNAMYTIVKFVGIRIMEVKLTGAIAGKRVMIQPAQIVSEGGIPGNGTATSNFIYSPTWIVR